MTNKYIKQGMNKDEASKKAYKEITKEEVELDEKSKGDYVLVDKDNRVVEKGTEEDLKQIALKSVYASLRVVYDPNAKIGARIREDVELDEDAIINLELKIAKLEKKKNLTPKEKQLLMVMKNKIRKMREEVELDEVWWDKAIAKLDQMTHPKEYGDMVTAYAKLMKQDKYKKRPNMAADLVAREYSKVSVREFIRYINTLVAKKILPQELKAEYTREEWSFKDFVQQIQKGPINEVLAKDADMGDYIDDFVKSDAPQFNGKSKEKRKEMAIAAYYANKESLET